jgi:cytochrome c oxidase subunit 1
MFGGYVFPFFAALYYWYPKITGRRMSEKLGKWHFWLLYVGFMTMSLGQMRVGLLGMRRRIIDYDPALNFGPTHIVVTIAGFMVATSVVILLINMFRSGKLGIPATGNLWQSRSPEWQLPSPTPQHNYPHPITVVGEPYDYGADDAYVAVDLTPASAHPAD